MEIFYRRNLEEKELEDCLALMNLVFIVNPTTSRDKWTWKLDKNGNLSFKCTMDLDTKDVETNSSLLNAIWTDFYPKKKKKNQILLVGNWTQCYQHK